MGEFHLEPAERSSLSLNSTCDNIGNGLYESETLLSFQNDVLGENHIINSLADNNTLYLSIDAQFWLINDVKVGCVGFTHKFPFCIEAFTLAGDFLLLGLTNGELHLLDVNSQQLVAKCDSIENVWFASRFFMGIYLEVEGGRAFLAVTKKGQVYSISIGKTENDQIHLDSVLLVDFAHNITASAYANGQLVATGGKLIVYDLFTHITDEDIMPDHLEFNNLYSCNESTFVGLKTDGALCYVCPNTLQITELESERLESARFYSYARKSYLYYASADGAIKLVEFNGDGDEELTLSADRCVHLVHTRDERENQMYVTRDASTLRVHAIVASKPEDRLRRLIRKRLFAEADAFALQHNLGRLEVAKAKVADYLESDACADADVAELLRLLADIPDGRFVAQACAGAVMTCETLAGVDGILAFVADLDWQFEAKDRLLEWDLNTTASAFDAYTSLARCGEVEASVGGFRRFNRCDMFEYLTGALRQGRLVSAIVVFSRLNAKTFTAANVATILGYLDRYTLAEFAAFLSAIVPITLLHLPAALGVFVETIVARVRAVERKRRDGEFPERAIELVDRMLAVLDGSSAARARTGAGDADAAAAELIDGLLSISKSLRTILELKNNYDIFLPLQDCLAGPGAILRALMRMNIKCIEKFLKNFLIEFMLQNGFDADEILGEEVGELLACHHEYWAAHVPQVWRCIGSVGKRLELLVPVLRAAPKPWCDDVRAMLAEALKWNHPLVTGVQYEAKNEPKYVVMYRREYELRNETLESMEKDMFVIQRIIHCNLPSLIEDVYTLCTSEQRKLEANFLLLRHFIGTDDLRSVFRLVNRHTLEERRRCFRSLCRFYKQSAVLDDAKLARTVYKALIFIADKAAMSVDETSANTYRIVDVLPRHMLCYDLLAKLESVDGRREVRAAIVQELCLDVEDFAAVLRQCKALAQAFDAPCDELLFDVCQHSNDTNFMRACAREFHENSESVDVLSLMTVLIMRRVGREKDNRYDTLFNDTIQNDSAGKPVDEQLLADCLALGRSLVAKALRLSGGKLSVANVFVWTQNTIYLRKNNAPAGGGEERPEKHLGRAYFPLGGGASSMYTMSTFNNVFTTFCDYVQKDARRRPNLEYLAHRFPSADVDDDDDDEEESRMSAGLFCNMLMTRLNAAVPSVLRENQHWTLLSLVGTLQWQLDLRAEPVNAQMRATFGRFKGKLLARVFAAPAVDERLAYDLLLSYPRKKALRVVNEAMDLYKMNLEKYESIVKLAMGVTAYYRSTDHYGAYWLGIKWRRALAACSLPQKTFFVLCKKNELLDPLIAAGEISLAQITRFCADFRLDAPAYYLKHLRHLIAAWRPAYEVRVDSFGERALAVAAAAAEEELLARCLEVVPLISNRHAVLECVDQLWNATSFYHYEVFMAILGVAAHLNDARHFNFRAVLQFLRGYRRASRPSEYENEEWCARFLYQSLDGISEWRFPFSPTLFTADVWKLLRSEVKLSNYERWFALADLLKHLSRDEICSIAVKDATFALHDEHDGAGGGYSVSAKFKPLFDDVDRCLAHIADPVLAASMAFHLIPKPPEGADRVIASRLAYEYAKKCRGAGVDLPNYGKIERGYFAYSSKHILHVHQLATEKYVAMLDCPDELIAAMYRDPRILRPTNSSLAQCPNINRATDELAALFQIDIREKRVQLLHTWLSDANARLGDANESICLLPDAPDSCEQNEECVIRAAYLCNSDVEHWRDHLHEIFQSSEDYLVQGRLLKTMCMISPPEYFLERYECSYTDILVTIDKFFVVHDIRSLEIMIDLEHLSSIDTNRLLYKLGKRLDDPKGVRVMIAVCDLYQVCDAKVWEKVIQAMIKLNMIKELKKCVALFVKENVMICRRVYVRAWQVVVDSMFEALEASEEEDADAALADVLRFVQSSPVLNRLNLARGHWTCMKLKRYAHAVLLLQYLPEAKRGECVAELLRRETKARLVDALERLQRCDAFIGVKYVMDLL